MAYESFEDLPVWQEAAALYEGVEDLLEAHAGAFTPGFKDQLDRAALSVSNNIAEGFERGTTAERLQFLYYAKGSAGEVRSMLKVKLRRAKALALRAAMEKLVERALSCARQLGGWTDHLQNSDIKGQRHLNDQSRSNWQKRKQQQEAEAKWREINRKHLAKLPPDHPLVLEAKRKGDI